MAVASGLATAAATGDPTASAGADAVWRFVLGAVVPPLSYRARPWSWILVSAIAAVGASGVARTVSAAGLALAVVAVGLRREHRLVGLVVGAAAVQGLVRMDVEQFHGDSAVAVAVAILPVIWSAYSSTGIQERRYVHRAALLAAGALLVVGGAALAGAAAGYSPTKEGMAEARAGLESARDGDTGAAVSHFERARAEFSLAHRWFDSWMAKPALAVPVVGQQLRALERAADASSDLSALAARTAAESDLESLRFEEGTMDVDRIIAMEDPLEEVEAALERSVGELRDVGSPWLLPQVAQPIGSLLEELRVARDEAALAVDGVRVAPGLLGSNGPRTYLVLFTTPAEARGLGGFVGAWAELRVDGGHVELAETGPAGDFEHMPGAEERVLAGPPDYLARYARFQPELHMQDVTLSPDFPSVAEVVTGLYPQTGGPEVQGVIIIDPFGLAGLLEITGPVMVEGLDEPLSSENAAEFLLRDQYLVFDEGQEDQQRQDDIMAEAAEATLDALLAVPELPGPRQLVDILGPVVDGDRLMVNMRDPAETGFLDEIGIDGAFTEPGDGDFFSLVTQNGGHNKIDTFLERSVSYDADFDPATGALGASVGITLRNTAPAEGLPDYLIGNTVDLPQGTNRMYLSFYSPHLLERATVDGEEVPFEVHEELGWWVYSRYVEVPAGSEVTVRLELTGHVGPGATYELRVDQQPLASDDHVSAQLDLPEGWVTDEDAGLPAMFGGGIELREDTSIEIDLEQP